jgi:hypothetical protein
MRKAKAFSEELDETINSTLIRWIVELNYPGAAIPRLRRNFDDLEQRDDPVKIVQMLTQLQAIGYEVKDLDWVRDKLEIPSLAKMDMDAMGAMGGMGGMPPGAELGAEPKSTDEMQDEEEGALGAYAADQSGSLELFDFSEFDEKGDMSDKTKKDKISKIIAEKFNGKLDDVGYERIISDSGQSEASVSRVHIDEYTSPGDIAYSSRRLMEEIKKIASIDPKDNRIKDALNMELGSLEMSVRQETISEEEIEKLIELYKKIYRLNRRVVHKECVVVDCKVAGYMRYFAPYFI